MTTYIYESPDKGKAVYRRKFGESKKELIKKPNLKEGDSNAQDS